MNNNYSTLQCYIKKQYKCISVVKCLMNLIQIVINIIMAFLFSKIIIDATTGNVRSVIIKAAEILSIVMINIVFKSSVGLALAKKESLKTHNCKMAFYNAFFNKSLNDLFLLQLGETKEKLNDDFNTITQKYATVFPNFLAVLLSAVAYISYLFFLDKWIALVFIVISTFQIIPPLIIKKYLQVNYDNCREIEAQITDFVVEGYRGFLTIKMYKLKEWWQNNLSEYHKKYSKIGRASIYTGTAEGVLDDIVSKILTYGTYGIVGMFILEGITSIDIGIQALAISGSLYSAVKASFAIIKDLAIARIAERRLAEEFSKAVEANGQIKYGKIRITDVSYSYDERKIFSRANFIFDSTKIVVIHGKNGSGKTTLLRLISGMLECDDGIITIDDNNPLLLSKENYPQKLFYLSQDDPTFDFTANELFEMVLPNKIAEAVIIAKRFGMNDQLIFESKINELSGGERKKVFLSLGFAINPIIMILDEPTNSLDELGRMVLKDMLEVRASGALIVTHDDFIDKIAHSIVEVNSEKY